MCVEIRIYQKHIVKLRTILPMSFSLKFWNFGPRLGQPFSNKGGPFYPQNIPLYEGEIKIFLFSKNWACWTKSIGNLGAKRKDNKLHTFPKNILWFSAYYILINLCVIKITLSTKIEMRRKKEKKKNPKPSKFYNFCINVGIIHIDNCDNKFISSSITYFL